MIQVFIIEMISIPAVILFIMMSITVLMNRYKYPMCRQTYNGLVTGKYQLIKSTAERELVRFTTHDSENPPLFDDEEIILFDYGKGSIKLSSPKRNPCYLHSGSLTYLDPMSYYWYLKIHRWWEENKYYISRDEIRWERA